MPTRKLVVDRKAQGHKEKLDLLRQENRRLRAENRLLADRIIELEAELNWDDSSVRDDEFDERVATLEKKVNALQQLWNESVAQLLKDLEAQIEHKYKEKK
ncbi:MAG: hypothetical protein E6Q97_39025 [Desulfurellales bacterium]|nr:MAG: hypothetical protein E6Q97_39025 [Desulfurellales bacterium]